MQPGRYWLTCDSRHSNRVNGRRAKPPCKMPRSKLVGAVAIACRAIVEPKAGFVSVDGGLVALKLVQCVSELFEQPCGGRVERRGPAEVAGGVVEVAPLAVGLAAPEMRQHRVRPKADGAAVVLDGGKSLASRLGRVAAGHQLPVVALADRRLIDDGGPNGCDCK